MPWFEVDEHFYSNSLPPPIAEARRAIKQSNLDSSGIELCHDLPTAETLLRYSNKGGDRDELIAVRSEALSEIKERPPIQEPSGIHWLGYDFVAVGHWSIIADGIFACPSYFATWTDQLNSSGLFDSPIILDQVLADYEVAARKSGVEPIPEELHGAHAIEVGRLVHY